MGNCKDCKHWGWLYYCEEVEEKPAGEKRRCDRLQVSGNVYHQDIAETSAEFGCVLFERKPEPELSPEAEDARKWCG